MLRTARRWFSLQMPRVPVRPLVAIVGATGTGKSDLAIDLARQFNGEIINGDAMQLYHGLPIITNKVSQEEMKGVPHHLLGCISLEEETWTVGRFVKKATDLIQDISSRGKLPILVGGTHYYTQSLLFQDALADAQSAGRREDFPVLEAETDVILNKLRELDPVMAERWHPNDRRKIQRSLEICLRTGRPASQIYEEQRQRRGDASADSSAATSEDLDTGPRYPSLVFWVHASKDVLQPRLDARVDKMLERGLLKEVETLTNFRSAYEAENGTSIDQSRGIWVSIGYKEFLTYQAALKDSTDTDPGLGQLKTAAIEKTQAATRQYANQQIRWIRIKLLNALFNAGLNPNTFLVDGSDLSKWSEHVLQPARDITKNFLAGESLPEPCRLSDLANEMLTPKRGYDLGQRPDLWQKKTCETCGVVATNENDWNLHVKSRRHKRAVGGLKKAETARLYKAARKKEEAQSDLLDILEVYQNGLDDAGERPQEGEDKEQAIR